MKPERKKPVKAASEFAEMLKHKGQLVMCSINALPEIIPDGYDVVRVKITEITHDR